MANSITWTYNTVMGDRRVMIGTFTATDGATGADVATGLNRIDLCLSEGAYSVGWSHTAGDLGAQTATSGDAFTIFVVGV